MSNESQFRKIHIYARRGEAPYSGNNWYFEFLGRVILPLYREFEGDINWFWFGQYYDMQPPLRDSSYMRVGRNIADYVPFRASIKSSAVEVLQKKALELIANENCWAQGWQPLNLKEDFPTSRYCMPNVGVEEHERRIQLIVNLLDASSRLVLESLQYDALTGWIVEYNGDENHNPNHSMFESIHHLFCNTTAVPLDVIVHRHRDRPAEKILTTIYDHESWGLGVLNRDDWEFEARIPVKFY